MVTNEYESRLERARQIDRPIHIVDRDPFVIRMEGSSDDEYTIVPNVGYCSCHDRQYRQLPCKHLLRLGIYLPDADHSVPSDVRESVLSGIAHRSDETLSEIDELEQRLDELRGRHAVWNDAVDDFHVGDPSYNDVETNPRFDSIEEWINALGDANPENLSEIERDHEDFEASETHTGEWEDFHEDTERSAFHADHDTEYLNSDKSYCHDCERIIPTAHADLPHPNDFEVESDESGPLTEIPGLIENEEERDSIAEIAGTARTEDQ